MIPPKEPEIKSGVQEVCLGDQSREEEYGFIENETKTGESQCQGAFQGCRCDKQEWDFRCSELLPETSPGGTWGKSVYPPFFLPHEHPEDVILSLKCCSTSPWLSRSFHLGLGTRGFSGCSPSHPWAPTTCSHHGPPLQTLLSHRTACPPSTHPAMSSGLCLTFPSGKPHPAPTPTQDPLCPPEKLS